jgi:hypothetical protein
VEPVAGVVVVPEPVESVVVVASTTAGVQSIVGRRLNLLFVVIPPE